MMLQLHLSDQQLYCLLKCALYQRFDDIYVKKVNYFIEFPHASGFWNPRNHQPFIDIANCWLRQTYDQQNHNFSDQNVLLSKINLCWWKSENKWLKSICTIPCGICIRVPTGQEKVRKKLKSEKVRTFQCWWPVGTLCMIFNTYWWVNARKT